MGGKKETEENANCILLLFLQMVIVVYRIYYQSGLYFIHRYLFFYRRNLYWKHFSLSLTISQKHDVA